MAATLDSSASSWMPWSPVIPPRSFRIRVKRWLRATSPGPPNKLGSSTLLAPRDRHHPLPPRPCMSKQDHDSVSWRRTQQVAQGSAILQILRWMRCRLDRPCFG